VTVALAAGNNVRSEENQNLASTWPFLFLTARRMTDPKGHLKTDLGANLDKHCVFMDVIDLYGVCVDHWGTYCGKEGARKRRAETARLRCARRHCIFGLPLEGLQSKWGAWWLSLIAFALSRASTPSDLVEQMEGGARIIFSL
jgi:hypothetical protein